METEFSLSQAVASGDAFEHRPSERGHCVQDFSAELDLRDLPGEAAEFEFGADDALPTAHPPWVYSGTSISASRAGRPSKLTPELQEQILTASREGGCTYADACRKAGISQSTFHLWKQKGQEQKKGRFSEVSDKLEKAEAEFRAHYLKKIQQAADESSVETRKTIRTIGDGDDQKTFQEVVEITRPSTWTAGWAVEGVRGCRARCWGRAGGSGRLRPAVCRRVENRSGRPGRRVVSRGAGGQVAEFLVRTGVRLRCCKSMRLCVTYSIQRPPSPL